MRLPTLAAFQEAAAFVHETLDPTPQIAWPLLAESAPAHRSGSSTRTTRPIGAFKVRGGLVFMDDLRRHGPAPGVIAATRGNHGQSIAFAAARLGLASTLVVPEGNAAGKNAAMAAFGGELVVHGADFEGAFDRAQALAAERGLAMVPSFDERLIRGVGTYALELFTAVPDLDAVYVPVGLGSGICGLMGVRDALGLKTEIIGVVAEGANCYALSFEARRPVSTNRSRPTGLRPWWATGSRPACPRRAGAPRWRRSSPGPRRARPRLDRQRLRRRRCFDMPMPSPPTTPTPTTLPRARAQVVALRSHVRSGLPSMQERAAMAGKKVGLILSGGNVDPGVYARALHTRLDSGPAAMAAAE